MASSVQEDDEERKSIFRCPVCLDMFNRPKVLGCGHSFCEVPCLSKIASDTGFLTCPECRVVSRLPSDGVSGLPTNFSLLRAISDGDAASVPRWCDTHKLTRNIMCYTCDSNICKQCVNGPEHGDHDSEISRVLETTRVAENSLTEFNRMLTSKREEAVKVRMSVERKYSEVGRAIKEAAASAKDEIDELGGALLMKLELETKDDRQRFADAQAACDRLLSTTCELKKNTVSLVDDINGGNTERLRDISQLESDVIGLYNNVLFVARESIPRRSQVVVFRPCETDISIGELKLLPAPPSRNPPGSPANGPVLDDPTYMAPQPAALTVQTSTDAVYENLTLAGIHLYNDRPMAPPLPNRGYSL